MAASMYSLPVIAVLIVFGAIGVLSDLALRGVRWAVAPWDR